MKFRLFTLAIFALFATSCGGDSKADAYPEPQVNGHTPRPTSDNKVASPGTLITLTGENLTNVAKVYIGETPAVILSKNATSLTFNVPEGDFTEGTSTYASVTAFSNETPERKIYDQPFWVWMAPANDPTPSITSHSPTTGVTVGATVTLTGKNLDKITGITLGVNTILKANFASQTATQIKFNIPQATYPAGTSTVPLAATWGASNAVININPDFTIVTPPTVTPPLTDVKIYVNTVEQLNALTINAGDTVVLRNGTFADKKIIVKANGTSSLPVVIQGETPGGVILTGKSGLAFSGSHITVRNLWFKNVQTPTSTNSKGSTPIEFRTSSSALASNSRLTNCAITNTAAAEDTQIDYKWVSLYGRDNQVDNCTFLDKRNIGTLMVVWLADGVVPAHKIFRNHFTRPVPLVDGEDAELNGQEVIRIGDSESSMQNASCRVYENYFYRCNGEIECISNKSCFNTYENNLLEECYSVITLRHGNDCTVEANYFVGSNNSKNGGVRIIGERHTVSNNYFENLGGNNYRAAICIIRGVPNPALSSYFQVKNATITGNVITNCREGIHANYGGSTMTQSVISTTVSNNVVSSASTSSNTAYKISTLSGQTAMDITWSGNIAWGSKTSTITEVPKTTTRPIITRPTTAIDAVRSNSGVSWTLN